MPDKPNVKCSVCGHDAVSIVEIASLRRMFCSACHHSQRLDVVPFSYRDFAMGRTANHAGRIQDQASYLAPYIKDRNSILELGCAGGELARVLRSAQTIFRYDGIEFSTARETAAATMNSVYNETLESLLASGIVAVRSYDAAICSHVLEHLEDVRSTVVAIEKALAPGGIVFIEVPNRSGHPALVIDDNRTHIHFFSVSSLTRLLQFNGFEVISAHTGARHDARCPDSLRIVARRYAIPAPPFEKPLSSALRRKGIDRIVVWGAGMMAEEMLAHYLDPAQIEFFVDAAPSKQGQTILGRPIKAPEALRETQPRAVLINSIEYERDIREELSNKFISSTTRIIGIAELLNDCAARNAFG